MPYPIVPPPASDYGALTWPRQLQRWLDDNSISALTRVGTYIQLPAFNQGTNTWNGYSDIVAAYNFEAPNNFSLKPFVAPSSPNYTLCISYRVGSNLTRYSLWRATGDNVPDVVIPYNEQFIAKNFRLEIWNTSQGQASDTNGFTFTTGKLGGIDYRYGMDSSLQGPDPEVTNFDATCVGNAGLTPYTTGVLEWFRGDSNLASGYWLAKQGLGYCDADELVPGGATFSSGNSYTDINDGTYAVSLSPFEPLSVDNTKGVPYNIWILFQYVETNDTICQISTGGGNATLSTDGSNTLHIDGTSLSKALVLDKWYIIEWWNNSNGNGCNVWLCEIPTPLAVQGYTGGISANSRASGTMISFGPTSTPVVANIAEIIMYNSQIGPSTTVQAQNLAYFMDRYLSYFNLPLTFPSNSVSITN